MRCFRPIIDGDDRGEQSLTIGIGCLINFKDIAIDEEVTWFKAADEAPPAVIKNKKHVLIVDQSVTKKAKVSG